MAKSEYDKIAEEYYEDGHVTSRNFDAATRETLADIQFQPPLEAGDLVLEIGAGRGRAHEFLGVDSKCIVQLDNSRPMFDLPQRESCLLKVLADACDIPLESQQFKCVLGFLVDPFLGLQCLQEVRRMLKNGGQILLTVPTKEWGDDLRARLGIDPMMTRFKKIGKEEFILLPSLLHSKEKLYDMLAHIGFQNINIQDHYLPQGENPISDDIESVAKSKDIDKHSLPIIHTIRATL